MNDSFSEYKGLPHERGDLNTFLGHFVRINADNVPKVVYGWLDSINDKFIELRSREGRPIWVRIRYISSIEVIDDDGGR